MHPNLDAKATIYISLSDAHMGRIRSIHVDNEKIEVKIPAGIRDGQRLRIKGKGNRLGESEERGDLYLNIVIINEVKVRDSTSARDTSYRNSGAGIKETVTTPTPIESRRDTSYRNSGAGIKETVTTPTPIESRRDTSYRNSGAGLVEVFAGSDTPIDTTSRNSGAGTKETLDKTQSAKRNTSKSHSKDSAQSHNIEEYIFWTDNNAFFYGKIAEWKEGRGNSFYAKNDIVCKVKCFTPDTRPPFTEYIKATCDMLVTERLIAKGQQIHNSCPLFRYSPQANKPSNQQASPQRTSVRDESTQSNQIADPIEGLDMFIEGVKLGYAFQVRDVLERIISTERERIENERGLWRLGAGLAGLAFGISLDGFDAGDLIGGLTSANIAGAAHQYASKEQIEFLKQLQSEWLVLDRSPMDIRRRLGEPQGRFIGISRENRLDMFNIHQSGSRGFHLVELDLAGNIARGFKDPQSLEVLQRSYNEEDIEIISDHLFPSTITPLKICRTITPEEARKKDPYFNQLSKAGAPFRVVYKDNTEGVMYKIPIPHHSDY